MNFREVVPIQDECIRLKIKQTYRLQFLKDVLARLLDDSTFSIFASMIYMNQISIVSSLHSSTDFMNRLFTIYKSPHSTQTVEKQREGVHFVHQVCLASKRFPNQQKRIAFSQLVSSGLFYLLEFALNDNTESIRMLGTELLLTIIDLDATLVRTHLQNIQGHNTFALMQTLVDLLFRENDIGLKSQAVEALKYMLDISTSPLLDSNDIFAPPRSCQELENDVFVASFYTNCCGKLFSGLADAGAGSGLDLNNPMSLALRALYEQMCNLLNFCVRVHGLKCRDYSIEKALWKGVCQLIRCPYQSVQLAAMQCLKQGLLMNDATYMYHFVENNLMESVIDVLDKMGNKNNLVNSACLELLRFVESTSIKPMSNMVIVTSHLVDSRRTELEHINFSDLPAKLLALHPIPVQDESVGNSSGRKLTNLSQSETHASPAMHARKEISYGSSDAGLEERIDGNSEKLNKEHLMLKISETSSGHSKPGRALKRRVQEDLCANNSTGEESPKTRRRRLEANKAQGKVLAGNASQSKTLNGKTKNTKDSSPGVTTTTSTTIEGSPTKQSSGPFSKKRSDSKAKKSEKSVLKKTLVSAGKMVMESLGKSKNSPVLRSSSASPSRQK